MRSILQRVLSGLLSTIVFSFGFWLFMWVGEGMKGNPAEGLGFIMFIALFSLPVFLFAGVLFSYTIDYVCRALQIRGRAAAYVVKFVMYSVAGYISLWMYLLMLTEGGGPYWSWNPMEFAYLGAAASLTYYHVLLVMQGLTGFDDVGGVSVRPIAPIVTERLTLVACTSEALDEAKAQGYPVGEHVEWYMSQLRKNPAWLGWGTWLVRLNETGKFIGDAGFKGMPGFGESVEIGYGFVPSAWGKGYGSEAARALVDWAFGRGVKQVTAETERTNRASIHLLEKMGFTKYHETDRFYYWQLYRP